MRYYIVKLLTNTAGQDASSVSVFIDDENKTGCRYLVVDAYNETTPLEYYRKNGFDFMFSTEEQEREYRNISGDGPLRTRLMFFDLMQIVSSC